MRNGVLSFFVVLAFAAGCASVDLTERNTTLVIAKKVVRDSGASAPVEISDVFTLEGPVVAFLTFRWDRTDVAAGHQRIEIRWFNGDREISRRTHEGNFGRPPHYVWCTTTAIAMGPGPCRADAFIDGKRVATKAFTVTEK